MIKEDEMIACKYVKTALKTGKPRYTCMVTKIGGGKPLQLGKDIENININALDFEIRSRGNTIAIKPIRGKATCRTEGKLAYNCYSGK
jgi:hypothetical protein